MLSIIMLGVIMLSVIMSCVIMLGVIVLSVVMSSGFMPSRVSLCVMSLCVVSYAECRGAQNNPAKIVDSYLSIRIFACFEILTRKLYNFLCWTNRSENEYCNDFYSLQSY